MADKNLLYQAITCVLDNAAKYSFPATETLVTGRRTGSDRFCIAVQNVGQRIRAREIQKCCQRGWRSEDAKAVTGEGSGIGLWLVDNIMGAHGGELEIVPTNSRNETLVQLYFPGK